MSPDSKVHGANTGPIWGRQDPDGPHVGPMDLASWVIFSRPHCVSELIQIPYQIVVAIAGLKYSTIGSMANTWLSNVPSCVLSTGWAQRHVVFTSTKSTWESMVTICLILMVALGKVMLMSLTFPILYRRVFVMMENWRQNLLWLDWSPSAG